MVGYVERVSSRRILLHLLQVELSISELGIKFQRSPQVSLGQIVTTCGGEDDAQKVIAVTALDNSVRGCGFESQ